MALARMRPPAAPDFPRRRGRFEGLRGPLLTGWAFDPTARATAARLLLAGDDGFELRVRADRYRADVQRAGHGDGHCGFAVPLQRLAAARVVHCRWADDGAPLPGSPWSLQAPLPPLARLRRGGWRLQVDAPEPGDGRLSGYALELAQPRRRLWLGLAGAGGALAQARACLYRADAVDCGDGFCGFVFERCGTAREPLRIVELASGRDLLRFSAPPA